MYTVDESGAFINPGQLNAIALAPGVSREMREVLERAALEILRGRNYADELHAIIDSQ